MRFEILQYYILMELALRTLNGRGHGAVRSHLMIPETGNMSVRAAHYRILAILIRIMTPSEDRLEL